jgi:hypothetical protein
MVPFLELRHFLNQLASSRMINDRQKAKYTSLYRYIMSSHAAANLQVLSPIIIFTPFINPVFSNEPTISDRHLHIESSLQQV